MASTIATPHRQHVLPGKHLTPACRLLINLLTHGTDIPTATGCTPDEFAGWCRRNKYPLLALEDRLPGWLCEDDAFALALGAEREWYETQRGEYLLVREAWRERGIQCLMIKSAGNPPAFPHTSDNIDILVRPEDGALARDILRGMGYVEVRNVEEPQKYLFRKFNDGRCVSAIHVHEQIAWFVGFLDDADVWARMRPAAADPQVIIPSPEDAILINLAHACYENKVLRLNDILRVRHALQTAGAALDWAYLERVATARGWRDGLAFMLLVHAVVEAALFGETLIPAARIARLEALVRHDRPVWRRLLELRAAGVTDLPLDLSYPFCKRLYYRKVLADPARSRRQRWRDVGVTLIWGIKLKSRIRPQPGFVVSLSGPDGSGKTAHAEALVAAIQLCEIKADYAWSRGGSTGLLGAISRARRRLTGSTSVAGNPGDAVTRRRQRLTNPIVRGVWAWAVALDQIANSWRLRLTAARGRVVVADRYHFDTAVEMDATLPVGARWSRLAIAAMLRCAPRSDLAYVLDVPPETARRRKPDEVWHAGFEAERDQYHRLAERHGLRALSTEGCFATSNDRLVREVIMAFMAGFETHLNALFYANPSQKNVPDRVWARKGLR